MKLIPLSAQRRPPKAFALVDDEDFERFGHLAWTLKPGGGGLRYAYRNVRGRQVYLHRCVIEADEAPDSVVDHINGDGLDNRRANLRLVTHAGNLRNRRPRTFGTSRYRGVYWNTRRQKWFARATFDYRQVWLGAFSDEAEAGAAVNDFWVSQGFPAPNHIEPEREAA